MKRLLRWTFLLASLLATVTNMWAQWTCVPVTGVSGVKPCLVTGNNYALLNVCPSGAVTVPGQSNCGYNFNPTTRGLTQFNGNNGWHLLSSISSLNSVSGFGYVQFTPGPYTIFTYNNGFPNNRMPTNDYGYYLAVGANTAVTSDSLTIQIGNQNQDGNRCNYCFNEFSLYWGSLDSWNSITFTDWSGQKVKLTGSQIATTLGLGSLGQNDSASFVLDFVEPAGYDYWQYVTLTTTAPAFEFDNIEWGLASGTCSGGGTCIPEAPLHAPVPEPSSLSLLGTGVCIGLGLLKRRLGR